MRIKIIRHTKGTPPGTILDWLATKGLKADVVNLHLGDRLPAVDDFDWVISLGGGMNVDEEEKHPFLREEKKLLKEAIVRGKTCLGLCLGGQMLSQVLGGKVVQHVHKEVGWHEVEVAGEKPVIVFQWHQDTFSLPPGATRFATNSITENQGFRYGDHVVGVQFHPEASDWFVRDCANDKEWPTGPYVQSKEEMLAGLETHLPALTKWFFTLLDQLHARTLTKTCETGHRSTPTL